MSQINDKEVADMYKKTEKLPGLDMYVNLNFDKLSKEDQAAYVLAAENYISVLEKLADSVRDDGYKTTMCHTIVFDTSKVFDPLEHRFLKEYPIYATKYVYEPIPNSWLGRRIRELNKYIQIYIPDPKASMSEDMAIERAVEDAQEYIDERIRVYNEWENIREKFG